MKNQQTHIPAQTPLENAEVLFGDCIKWLGLEEEYSFEKMVDRWGMNVNDICESVAKSNLSSFHPVDIQDDEYRVQIWIDVPGFEKDELEVRIKGETLTISGELDDSSRPLRMYMKERAAPKFRRILTLPTKVTAIGCSSTLENGVLHLSLLKVVPDEGEKISL